MAGWCSRGGAVVRRAQRRGTTSLVLLRGAAGGSLLRGLLRGLGESSRGAPLLSEPVDLVDCHQPYRVLGSLHESMREGRDPD